MVGIRPTLRRGGPAEGPAGYVFIMLLFLLAVMAVGMMVAYPVWRTQIQREKEDELIFRGKQYVEAVRLYQAKNPGRLPKSLKELYQGKFLRKLFPDPMVPGGAWNIILQSGAVRMRSGSSPQEIIVAPASSLASLTNPLILGVVSSSPAKSIKVYNNKDTYDQWLFYFGQDPSKNPAIVYIKTKSGEVP